MTTLPQKACDPKDPKMVIQQKEKKHCLGGGFKYFLCSPWSLGKIPILTSIFFKVGWKLNHQTSSEKSPQPATS